MATFLQFALWNANGLAQHALELQTFLACRNIDIMLLSETHFTLKSYLRIPHYTRGDPKITGTDLLRMLAF
jgi:hypothetical protein